MDRFPLSICETLTPHHMHNRTLVLSLFMSGLLPELKAQSAMNWMQRGAILVKRNKIKEALEAYIAVEKASASDARPMVRIAIQYSYLMTDATGRRLNG